MLSTLLPSPTAIGFTVAFLLIVVLIAMLCPPGGGDDDSYNG